MKVKLKELRKKMRKPTLALIALAALCLFTQVLTQTASAATTRTESLSGSCTSSATPLANPSTGVVSYYSGLVVGSAAGDINGTFVLSVAFNAGELVDPVNNVYSGVLLYPNSSFSLSSSSGKNNTLSGTIDSGLVTYTLNPNGTAKVIGVTNAALTIRSGKGSYSKVSGGGTLDFGSANAGSGTMTLNF